MAFILKRFFFFNKTYSISVRRVVYWVSITQGQTWSSSFRTCAVSAFTAHRLISLMQSKHVINGPSQPPLFVVRQTLKSNVSTMGGKKICWHGRSADVRYFSHAENSFILLLFFLTQHEKDDSFVQIKRLLSTAMWCLIVLFSFLI